MIVRTTLAAVAILLALPSAAAAHATLISATPSNDAVLEAAPDQIVLRFSEPVQTLPNSVRLFDGVGRRVPVGKIAQRRPNELLVPLEGELERGSYTVVWRVNSDDLDLINDFFVFHVAVPRPLAAGASQAAESATPGAIDGAADVARFASYLLVLLCAGGSAALALGAAPERVRPRLLELLCGLAAALAVVSLLEIALDGAGGLGEAVSPRHFGDVLRTTFGAFTFAQAVLALVLAAAAAAARRALPWAGGALPGPAAPLLVAPALLMVAIAAGVVDATPARTNGGAATSGAFRASMRMGTLDARLAIAPAQIGWNRVELELPPPTGAEGGYFEVRVRATLEAAELGPLHFRGVQETDPAHFSVRRMYLPLPGRWTLNVAARRGITGRYEATVTLPVDAPPR